PVPACSLLVSGCAVSCAFDPVNKLPRAFREDLVPAVFQDPRIDQIRPNPKSHRTCFDKFRRGVEGYPASRNQFYLRERGLEGSQIAGATNGISWEDLNTISARSPRCYNLGGSQSSGYGGHVVSPAHAYGARIKDRANHKLRASQYAQPGRFLIQHCA